MGSPQFFGRARECYVAAILYYTNQTKKNTVTVTGNCMTSLSPQFHNPEWLEKAVFYEIYPQTFYDSNADGIGDIPGIIEKLDYVQALGATAIWLNPCFESPFGDAGYDVSDFRKVAPRYGTNEDLKQLFDEANKRGMRVVLDLVAGHTSTEHPWFQESSRHERNPYSDYYVWTGSVWERGLPNMAPVRGMSERNAGYIPNFFYFQPALNYGFANPDPEYPWQQPVDAPGPQAVRQELLDIMKFWLDLGASGFRVDMAASLIKNDPGHRTNIRLWQGIRAWMEKDYPEAVLMSEWSYPERAIQAGFHIDFYIHFGTTGYTSLFRKNTSRGMGANRYSFSFFDKAGLGNITEFVDDFTRHYQATRRAGYICIPSGNHDIHPRLGFGRDVNDLKVAYVFLMTMPGVPKIYYGDEIGMQGVPGLPSKEGGYERTAARTPMQWSHGPNAGFSFAKAEDLYLPVEPELDTRTVADQDEDQHSLLNTVRMLIQLRRAHPALCNHSAFKPLYAEAGKYPFVFLRQGDGETIIVAVNPSDRPVEVVIPASAVPAEGSAGKVMALYGPEHGLTLDEAGWCVRLSGVSAGIYKI
jgi:maltose alpha-D-glucosyltransferase/alpha-amylase